jgi:repressor of nif and glnA expression
MKSLVKKSKPNLTNRQITCLKILKRAPKTTTKLFDQLVKKNTYVTKQAVRGCMRVLENRSLVRARSQWDKKLKRDVIVWELTAEGRKALE